MDHSATDRNILRERFLLSARPIVVFSKATGVFLPQSKVDSILWDKLRFIWSGLWLLMNTQSGLYIFLRRGLLHVYKILFESKLLVGGMLTEQLNGALMRVAAFLFETSTHFILVFSIRPTLKRFFDTLEPIYCRLGCPDLSRIRTYSNLCLTFTIWTTILNIACAWYWEFYHPARPFNVVDAVENTIRKVNTIFALMALWLFAICGQILVLLYQKIRQDLQEAVNRDSFLLHSNETLWAIISNYRILSEANRRFHRDFRSILMINICLSTINILTSAYYGISFFFSEFWIVTLWDFSDVAEFCFRLWLICHTTDHIRSSAMTCIPVLRRVRAKMVLAVDQNKITLFIVEIAQLTNDSTDIVGFNVFGLLPTNKRLMLKSIETISTFLIIIFQFKNWVP